MWVKGRRGWSALGSRVPNPLPCPALPYARIQPLRPALPLESTTPSCPTPGAECAGLGLGHIGDAALVGPHDALPGREVPQRHPAAGALDRRRAGAGARRRRRQRLADCLAAAVLLLLLLLLLGRRASCARCWRHKGLAAACGKRGLACSCGRRAARVSARGRRAVRGGRRRGGGAARAREVDGRDVLGRRRQGRCMVR